MVQEICMMAVITKKENLDVPKLAGFINPQFIDSDCKATVTTGGKYTTCSTVEIDGVFVRVFFWNGPSPRIIHASLQSFEYICAIFFGLLLCQSSRVRLYEKKRCNSPIWPATYSINSVTAVFVPRTVRATSIVSGLNCSSQKTPWNTSLRTSWSPYRKQINVSSS